MMSILHLTVAVFAGLGLLALATTCRSQDSELPPVEDWRILKHTVWYNDAGTMLTDRLRCLAREADACTEARRAAVRSTQGLAARKREIEEPLLDILGGLPEKTPLNARVTGRVDLEEYVIDNVVYESLPGFGIAANLFIPKGRSFPAPAVICPCGHSRKEDPVHHGMGAGLASNGYVALVVDSPNRGERCDPGNEHFRVGALTYLTGANSERYFMWDVVRGIDYLLTREEVDPDRISCTGVSGGAVSTLHAAALDKRIKCAAPVCGVIPLRQLIETLYTTCPEQLQQDTLGKQIDEMEVAALIAPRPMMLLQGHRDEVFFVPDFIHGCQQIAHYYEVSGHRDRITWAVFDSPHDYSGEMREAIYEWMGKWIGDDETTTVDPGDRMQFPEPEELACHPEISSTIFSVNADIARSLAQARGQVSLSAEQVREQARSLLGVDSPPPPAEVVPTGTMLGEGIAVEKVVLQPEPDIQVPLWVLRPQPAEGPLPAVLYADGHGKARDAEVDGPIRQLVEAGYLVVAPDVRGIGETAMSPTHWDIHSYCDVERVAAWTSFVLSKPVLGMRVTDVLCVLGYMRSRPDVNSNRIALWGKGQGGVWALDAALLDQDVAGLIVENAPTSYLGMATDMAYSWNQTLLLPNVLRHHDLPEVTGALAPRPVLLVNPADSRERPVSKEAFGQECEAAWHLYRTAPGRLVVHCGLEIQDIMPIALGWLNDALRD